MGASVSISDDQKFNHAKLTNRPVNFDVGDSLAVFVQEMIARSPVTDEFTRILDTEVGKEAFTQFLIREYVNGRFAIKNCFIDTIERIGYYVF